MANDRMSFDEYDEIINPRDERTQFDEVVDRALSRRGFLGGVMSFGAGGFVAGTGTATALGAALLPRPAGAVAADRFGFDAIAANTLDTVTVPEGYEWKMLVSWGDPLWSDVPAFDPATRGTAESQARAFGDNNDGMALFERDGTTVIAVNNEYTNRDIIWGNRPEGKPADADDLRKGMMAHGVSVMEIRAGDEGWSVIQDSPLNRRITPMTDMTLTGPAAGHELLRTAADPEGTTARGTWNNCGNGRTPWGTYLTCEENFNGYFSASQDGFEPVAELKRYGISDKDWGYGWAAIDARFDVSQEPNEPNRAGYVVEVDPFDPQSTPRKLTALGRFKHENAELVMTGDGRAVVYMGDDERGEFLYRFVSDPPEAGAKAGPALLEKGTLYAARFTDDQTGRWLPLTPETTGMTEAEICIHTRQAASSVGATTMDRPEWVASHPERAEVYVALTNNKNRGLKPNAGGDETPVGGPNPREANVYGQILRWRPADEDHTSDEFAWDLFALAGNPEVHDGPKAGSDNINAGNMFNSPDGMSFDRRGMLWIQTDGKYSNEGDFAGMGNNQMLVGDTTTGEIRRFLVGPRECEVTGMMWAPDGKTVFVGIQHPGEDGNSAFPGTQGVPRSGIVAVRRTDGAQIA
ncbi:transcriptional initiation protein Tat [Brevirhabdus pacifica]|uniref:Transcriptional initiation protein Tat n=1 Tax=Brevirhabdus pacifica TaxID=1267768 RepID=A0A1U7DK44_9RHOB|nr:PhoX family phosphatase [Brevirhabdus pacifica]APX90238.1 transcriptional initiation protein Tat [Brevirhabdus pacifica]OWU78713.1 transcriptional initiation protein Tat [Loktanella sp. 22II-4b]PJJ80675.1 hypothetical protein CLV77_2946 [Brevirhabdus pacifica]